MFNRRQPEAKKEAKMFSTQIKSILIATTLALGALSATSGTASAEVRGGIYIGGPNFSVGISSGGYGHRYGGYRDRRWDLPLNRCNPRKAVRKAKRRGVRRAHVVRVGKRGVVVAGRKWGERVVIGFGRKRSCPVRFVNAR